MAPDSTSQLGVSGDSIPSPILHLLNPRARAEGAEAVAAKYGAESFVVYVRPHADLQFEPGPGFLPSSQDKLGYALVEYAATHGPQFVPDDRRAAVTVGEGGVVEFSGVDRPVKLEPHDADLLVAVVALLRSEVDVIADAEGPANRHVREVLESITDAFFLLDSEWRFTYANRKALDVLSRSSDNLIGKDIWVEFSDAVGTLFHSEYLRAMTTRTTVEFTEYYPPPLDSWYQVKVYPAIGGGLSVYFTDISDRRRLEEAARSVSTPIMDIGDRVLLVPLVGLFDRRRAVQLSNQFLAAIRSHRARVAVVDVTGLALVDIEIVERLRTTLSGAHLLGCKTITVGVSSAIARDLVHAGSNSEALRTCLDLKHGLELARHLLTESATVRPM